MVQGVIQFGVGSHPSIRGMAPNTVAQIQYFSVDMIDVQTNGA